MSVRPKLSRDLHEAATWALEALRVAQGLNDAELEIVQLAIANEASRCKHCGAIRVLPAGAQMEDLTDPETAGKLARFAAAEQAHDERQRAKRSRSK